MFDIGEVYKYSNFNSGMYLFPGDLFDIVEKYKHVDLAQTEYNKNRTNGNYGFVFTVVDKKERDGYCIVKLINNDKLYTFFHEIGSDDRHLVYMQKYV